MPALMLAGCSFHTVDSQGTHRIIGLVNLTLPATDASSPYAGRVVDLKTIGASWMRDDQSGALSLGYSRERFGFLRDNALVQGDVLDN